MSMFLLMYKASGVCRKSKCLQPHANVRARVLTHACCLCVLTTLVCVCVCVYAQVSIVLTFACHMLLCVCAS